MSETNSHGTGLVLDGRGVLLRGRSGAGKSLLALQLLDLFESRGKSAKLVSDDRVELTVSGNRLVMSAPEQIAGLIELRGRGIVTRPHANRAGIDLVVDLVTSTDRFLEEDALVTTLEGVSIARCPVPERGVIDSAHQILLVTEALRALATEAK